jgi:hypothetical protein
VGGGTTVREGSSEKLAGGGGGGWSGHRGRWRESGRGGGSERHSLINTCVPGSLIALFPSESLPFSLVS